MLKGNQLESRSAEKDLGVLMDKLTINECRKKKPIVSWAALGRGSPVG